MAEGEVTLELTFALKHVEQHLIQNDLNVKKLEKLNQKIELKEKRNPIKSFQCLIVLVISCKGATKIYQTYESIIQDIQSNINTIDHILRLCDEGTSSVVKPVETEMEAANDAEMIPSIPLDTLVAALTLTGEGSEEWILARIKGFDGTHYVVEDAEVEEEPSIEIAQKEVYTVLPDALTIIPEDEEVALARPEFRLKQSVLALFPGTTCFYPSTVMSVPSRVFRKKTRDYLLKFADDDVSSRPCPARYVLQNTLNK